MTRSVLVVGSGFAGARAALGLRSRGFTGTVTLVGDEPVTAYSRPPLSKSFQLGADDHAALAIQPEQAWAEAGIDLRLGRRAIALERAERTVTLDDGAVVPYDELVVATGVRARRIAALEPFANVHTLRSIVDAERLRATWPDVERICIVGCGFIGAELAAVAAAQGKAVTIIEAAATPFARLFGDDVGLALARLHQANGVDMRLGVTARSFSGRDRVDGIELSDGSSVPADLVVVSIGVDPATQWLSGSGLDITDGLAADECSRAAPHIWAAGDVARWHHLGFDRMLRIEHWSNAGDHGAAVAANIMSPTPEPYIPLPYFWSDQFDAKIQYLGVASPAGPVDFVVGSPDESTFIALYGSADGTRLDGALGFRTGRALMRLRSLFEPPVAWADAPRRARELLG